MHCLVYPSLFVCLFSWVFDFHLLKYSFFSYRSAFPCVSTDIRVHTIVLSLRKFTWICLVCNAGRVTSFVAYHSTLLQCRCNLWNVVNGYAHICSALILWSIPKLLFLLKSLLCFWEVLCIRFSFKMADLMLW